MDELRTAAAPRLPFNNDDAPTRQSARPVSDRDDADALDEGMGRIRPRARLIRTIGAELISSEIVAVIELVRNCYDADATRVDIHFTDPHLDDATVEIRDDGHGMDRDVLLGPWLEPATDHKSGKGSGPFGGQSSPRGRRRLGSKGVGRFATQRLGNALVLTTSTGEDTELEATFDWKTLDNPDHYLDQLEIPWAEYASDAPWHGTSLMITRLRDRWTPERFERLRLGLARLIGPSLGEDEFQIVLHINGASERIRPAIDRLEPMYSLSGTVEAGLASVVFRDIAGVEEEWERSVIWPDNADVCGPFEFRICAWDLDRDAFDFYVQQTDVPYGIRDFRRLIRDHSGVSLYRDGFRILPYGEPDNDWLRLDRRRVNNPTLRLSNNQVLGLLQLSADENPLLRDQTNREGLVTNEAYQHLQAVVLELLGYLETRRFTSRRTIGLGSNQTTNALPALHEGTDKEIDDAIDGLAGGAVRGEAVDELRTLVEKRREELSDTVRNYAGLATTGQMSSLVFRQLEHPLRQARAELNYVLDELKGALEFDEDVADEVSVGVSKVARLLDEMATRMEKMDPLATVRRGRKRVQVELDALLRDVMRAFLDQLVELDVDYDVVSEGPVEAQTDPTVVQQACALVLDNALYWIGQSPDEKVLRIHVDETGFSVFNSGPPIPPATLLDVFEPHYTTRPDASGMGLTLARDLLRSVGARIVAEKVRNGARFRVTLPAV